MRSFVVFDLEYTTWPGALENGWSGPGRLREIVQIGALRLSADLAVVEEFEALVRPVVNPGLSDYFTGLTGISQDSVDRDGRQPADALGDFLVFCQDESVLSYGNDMVVLGENVGWVRARGEEVKNAHLGGHFVSVRGWINRVAPQTTGINVGRLWQVLDLPKPVGGQEHSALFDCYSFAAALRWLEGQGHPFPL